MKSVDEVLKSLAKVLEAEWHGHVAATTALLDDVPQTAPWPRRLSLGKPTREDLTTRFSVVQRWALEWRRWARDNDLRLDVKNTPVSGTRQELPTHVFVPDVGGAARLLGQTWVARLERAHERARRLRLLYPRTASAALLRRSDGLRDVDFDLLCRAATWFADPGHDATGRTPRQVPIEGLHAKWLDNHQGLVAGLSDRPDLCLVKRPQRVDFTYLDPAHRRAGGRHHDSITLGDSAVPAYAPRGVVITENKDTAVFFPEFDGGVAVQGNGSAAPSTLPGIPWMHRAATLVYWGDVDARGYEIVHGLRARGLPVETVLMDWATYLAYERFGTSTESDGTTPVPCRDRRALPLLTDAEREVYQRLTDPGWERTRRIEQERIPLPVALSHVLALQRLDD